MSFYLCAIQMGVEKLKSFFFFFNGNTKGESHRKMIHSQPFPYELRSWRSGRQKAGGLKA